MHAWLYALESEVAGQLGSKTKFTNLPQDLAGEAEVREFAHLEYRINIRSRKGMEMRLEDLERYLERGNELGFIKQTDTDEYLGWILVRKQKPNERILELFSPPQDDEDACRVAKEEAIRAKPYVVQVIELKREVHEGDDYESNEDYHLNESHRFATLDEVQRFVQRYGHTLEEIKWRIDLDAP